jgi:hypothetical protein
VLHTVLALIEPRRDRGWRTAQAQKLRAQLRNLRLCTAARQRERRQSHHAVRSAVMPSAHHFEASAILLRSNVVARRCKESPSRRPRPSAHKETCYVTFMSGCLRDCVIRKPFADEQARAVHTSVHDLACDRTGRIERVHTSHRLLGSERRTARRFGRGGR